jgi:hypothetical protein
VATAGLSGCSDDPAAPPVRPAADYRAPAGVLLAPPSDEGEEATNPTFRVLSELIVNTPPDERIRIVGNSFSYVPVAELLAAAHERGVHVQVLLYDEPNRGWKAPEVLVDALGEDRRAASFVQLAPGSVHQKVWSFTRSGRSRDVTLTGSMNLTYYSAGQYTDMYSFVGRPDVRRALDRRFEQLSRGLPDPPAYGPLDLGGERVWFYPGSESDPVRDALVDVPPVGARIRVVMYAWLDERGLELARLLVDLDSAGADVEVVLGRSVGPLVRELLLGSGVEVHPGVFADGDDIHHKLTVVSHPAPGGGRTRFVLTGSDNWTTRSLARPELVLRLEGHRGRTFDRYDRWVDGLVRRGEREQN